MTLTRFLDAGDPTAFSVDCELDAVEVCARLRASSSSTMFLDGSGGFDAAWGAGRLIGVDPQVVLRHEPGRPGETAGALERLNALVARRRAQPGSGRTGLAVLLGYDLFESIARPAARTLPSLLALAVDRSLCDAAGSGWSGTVRSEPGAGRAEVRRLQDALRRRVESACGASARQHASAARAAGAARTSLPVERYLAAVRQVKRHIERGDIYQANLCQRFAVRYAGDPLRLFGEVSASHPAPRSAYLECDGFAMASLSPETFLIGRPPDEIESHPIKGTRPRGAGIDADRAQARALLESSKDRAELLMIVDLERNDLGRICRPGTVRTPELAGLRSFPELHHLVGRVEGRLRPGIRPSDVLKATFPGGSITGAPKIRAMQILDGLEPVRRGLFTGSLMWFGDDGSMESSILIRTVVFADGLATIGAGGGIVADSDPEQEWLESNHKASMLTRALGFRPEQAGVGDDESA